MPEIKIIGNRIIVEIISREEAENQELRKRAQQSGLHVPKTANESAQGAPYMGVVYDMAPDVDLPEIKPGDTVIFREPNPKGFKWDGKKLLALEPEQVIAKIQE